MTDAISSRRPYPRPPLHVVVMLALAELTSVERTALELIYWHGRTQAQVAAELRVPVPTIRAAVGRGMRHVARRVQDR